MVYTCMRALHRTHAPASCLAVLNLQTTHALQGVSLHALIDSCHSGTVMSLPWDARLDNGRFQGWEQAQRQPRRVSLGLA